MCVGASLPLHVSVSLTFDGVALGGAAYFASLVCWTAVNAEHYDEANVSVFI